MKNLVKELIYWIFIAIFLTIAICGYLFLVILLLISDVFFIPFCFLYGLFNWSSTVGDSFLVSIKKEFKVLYDLHDMIITMPFRN